MQSPALTPLTAATGNAPHHSSTKSLTLSLADLTEEETDKQQRKKSLIRKVLMEDIAVKELSHRQIYKLVA